MLRFQRVGGKGDPDILLETEEPFLPFKDIVHLFSQDAVVLVFGVAFLDLLQINEYFLRKGKDFPGSDGGIVILVTVLVLAVQEEHLRDEVYGLVEKLVVLIGGTSPVLYLLQGLPARECIGQVDPRMVPTVAQLDPCLLAGDDLVYVQPVRDEVALEAVRDELGNDGRMGAAVEERDQLLPILVLAGLAIPVIVAPFFPGLPVCLIKYQDVPFHHLFKHQGTHVFQVPASTHVHPAIGRTPA